MRVHVEFSSFLVPVTNQSPVVQVEKVPSMGASGRAIINGKFLLPTPLDLDFPIYGVKSGTISNQTDAGAPSNYTVVNVSANHGMKEGDLVSIAATGIYDGVHIIHQVDALNSFTLPVAFTGSAAGTWKFGDYLLDAAAETDGYDLASQGMARLLAAYPTFGNVYFNPLLTEDHVNELDFAFEFHDPDGNLYYPRMQTGREAPLADSGQYPTHTALLPANSAVTPTRPGLMVSDNIAIGAYTLDCDGNQVGTDEFMLWWKLYEFDVTHDVSADFGKLAGQNEPALRYVEEKDSEPPGFSAYISTDGGANWCLVGLLEPVAFCVKTKNVMIAFKNTSSTKQYVASYALLF